MRESSPIPASSSSLEEYCLSSDSSSSLEEYCLSTDSTSSLEEYCLSTDSSSSLEEYCLRSAAPKRLKANETSEEFSIEEYDINKDTDNEDSVNETTKTMEDAENTELDCNKVTPTMHEEKSGSPMHIRRIPRRIRLARFNLVTSDKQIGFDVNKTCCARGCMSMIGKTKLRELRRHYFSMTGDEQDIYLTSHMQLVTDKSAGIKVSFEYYIFHSQQICRVAFKIALRVSNMRLHRVQQRLLSGDQMVNSKEVPSMKGAIGRHAMGWMKNYFKLNCEVMPTTGRMHLADNYTRREVYDVYRTDMLGSSNKSITYSQFTRLWSSSFSNVIIPRKVRMGYCSICANLKSLAKGAKTSMEKERSKKLLQEHREAQSLERKKAMHHREKCLKMPEQYMCLMIDGMDQKKTCLPHMKRLPKDINDECLVQMHLVGCLAYNRSVGPHVFITYPNVHNDPNLTVTVIHRVLMSWGQPFPPVLYIQLDNTARENKNSTVFGYLSMLVNQGLFRKVKVNFLLVGHTHDHIDQMFSTFSRQLSRQDAFTLPKLFDVICDAYTPRPKVLHLKEIYDFKRYISDGGVGNAKVLAQLNNISFNHIFMIKKNEISGSTLLYAKQYSSSTNWEPEGGCQLLLCMSGTIVHGAKQMPIEKKGQLHSELVSEQKLLWLQALEEKRKHIEAAKKYAAQQDTSWWDIFFSDQKRIIDNCVIGDNWTLETPFTWSLQHDRVHITPEQTTNAINDSLVHPQQRDIYVGPRMTKAAEARWQGNLQELAAGMLIATPADENSHGHQFWVGKILEVLMHETENTIKFIKVHWYNTRSENAFTGKYTLEMIECPTTRGGKKRKRNIRNTSTLDISDVDIIVYDFTLTKAGRLRKSTVDIIKEKLPSLQSGSSRRQTRSATYNLHSHHLVCDEDNALIGTSEDDEEESSLYISYSSDSP